MLHHSTDDPSRFLKDEVPGPAPVDFSELPRDPVVFPDPDGVHAVEACGRAQNGEAKLPQDLLE